MSAGSQIQMAPQSTVNSGQSVHSQDSNMSTGTLNIFLPFSISIYCHYFILSLARRTRREFNQRLSPSNVSLLSQRCFGFYSHSALNMFYSGSSHSDKEVDPNTPEKVPRTPSERKRKRKVDDGVGGVPGGPVGGKGARSVAALDNKKINDYFVKHHPGSSPIRLAGAKSPSPQQGYPMVSSIDGVSCRSS